VNCGTRTSRTTRVTKSKSDTTVMTTIAMGHPTISPTANTTEMATEEPTTKSRNNRS